MHAMYTAIPQATMIKLIKIRQDLIVTGRSAKPSLVIALRSGRKRAPSQNKQIKVVTVECPENILSEQVLLILPTSWKNMVETPNQSRLT